MTIVCIDTQILSFGLIKTPPKGHEHLVNHAAEFLKWIEKQQYRVIVPTIVVSELLTAVPEENHVSILKLFERDWLIVDFDLRAARQFANMRGDHIRKNRLHHMIDPNRPGATREALKADVMIIATAIAHNADIIYTHDRNLLKLAEGFIEAKLFQDLPYQMPIQWQDGGKDEQ